jgi:hypothetical protein
MRANGIITSMEQLIKFALLLLKVYFNVILWLIEAGMKYWRTILVAVVVGGFFFAAVYFYNFYLLDVPSRNLIVTLIVVWLAVVYLYYDGDRNRDVEANIKTIKGLFEKLRQRIEKDLTR